MMATEATTWTIEFPADRMAMLDEVSEHEGVALTLDPRDCTGVLAATYGRGVGDGTLAEIWHGLVQRIWLPEDLDCEIAKEYLESDHGKTLLARIADGHSTHWDGSNWLGGISEDAYEALREIEEYLSSGCGLADQYENAGRWDAGDWFNEATYRHTTYVHIDAAPEVRITTKTTDEELQALAERFDDEARANYISLRGTYDYLQRLREYCEEEADNA